MTNNRTERVIISLHAHKLKNVAGAFKGTSDPYAIVTRIASDPHEQPKVLGQTEVIKNSLSPTWVKTFIVNYEFAKLTRLNIGVYDEVRKSRNDKPMGSAVFEIGAVFGAAGNMKAKKLKGGGILYLRVEKAPEVENVGTFHCELKGLKLNNIDKVLGTCDPFVEISKRIMVDNLPSWQIVHRSEVVKKNANPTWKRMTIGVNEICDNNREQSILITVRDWSKKGKHMTLGSFETSLNAVLRAKGDPSSIDTLKTFQLKKKGKVAGKIVVVTAMIDHAGPAPPPRPITSEVRLEYSNASLSSSASLPVPLPPPTTAQQQQQQQQQPTWLDYVSGGLELQLSVAIDFTGSNGDPRRPGTLHYIDRAHRGELNDYERALTAVGSIIGKYDSDQSFPLHGFGAKFRGIINHCFRLGATEEVNGINGMLEAYRAAFKSGLTMSGPTVFAEVIELAAIKARTKQEHYCQVRRGKQSYTVLLILTDGAVSNVQLTKKAIMAASDAPLSIVIVGIGNADFGNMQFLDDFSTEEGGRDICQFVEFNRYKSNKILLSQASLEEIPDQVVGYFQSRGIAPLPVRLSHNSHFDVVPDEYDEEIDLDLSFTFGEDGEINLAASPNARIDDTTFGTYEMYGGLTPLPVPSAPPAPSQGGAPHMSSAPNLNYHHTTTPMAPPSSSAPNLGFHQSGPISYNHPGTIMQQQPAHHNVSMSSLHNNNNQGYPPPSHGSASQQQVVQATVVHQPQQFFYVQLPPNVQPGQQLQIQNPQTQQPMIITAPQGVPPGGMFPVSY